MEFCCTDHFLLGGFLFRFRELPEKPCPACVSGQLARQNRGGCGRPAEELAPNKVTKVTHVDAPGKRFLWLRKEGRDEKEPGS